MSMSRVNKLIKRHINEHGFDAVYNGKDTVYICIEVVNHGRLRRQLYPCITLSAAYMAMGY